MLANRRLSFLIIILHLLLIPSFSLAGSVSPESNSSQTFTYTGGANSSFAKVTLVPDSSAQVGSLLMFVKTTTGITTTDTNLSTYQHMSPTLNSHFDLEHANTGSTQVVQLNLGSTGTTLHVTVYNFETNRSLSYTVTATESPSSDTSHCQNPQGTPSATSLYCSSCTSPVYIGAYCNIMDGSIQKDVTYLIQLRPYGDPRNFVPFTIPGSSNKVSLFYSITSTGVYNFIQFKDKNSDVAGWMNYVISGGKNQISKANTQYTVNINSDGKDISVSFWNPNNNLVNITVWYNEESSSNLLLIILAVLGGVLFILLVVVAIYIVKRMNSNDMRQVNPQSPLRNNSRRVHQNLQNVLTAQQIDSYFPAVLCKNVYEHQQLSSNNLMQEKNKENVDRDCVICLCPIESTDMMRVTYCRHLFHSHCLVKWFQKNRNCPYCRQEFGKKSTIEKYTNLVRNANKNHLMGVDLAIELLLTKQSKSSFLIEDIKD